MECRRVHFRSTIVDLTPEGQQPMASHGGRYVIAFNGEIYNFRSLRAELVAQGHVFRGGSDTEVLLAAIEEHGLAAALNRISGMFAFALWDRQERQLHLVRDRLGKKPLYYGLSGGRLIFASELKAIMRSEEHTSELQSLMRISYAVFCLKKKKNKII